MKYNHIYDLLRDREYLIEGLCDDITQLNSVSIRFITKQEKYDPSLCKCQIVLFDIDKKPSLTYDDLKSKYKELMDAEPMRLLRIERTKRLDKSDYRFKPDYKHKSNTHKLKWEEYRQYLRDLPQTAKPELDENGDLSFNFMDEPDDTKIQITNEISLPTNEDFLSENIKLKEQLKEMNDQILFIKQQLGLLNK